MDLVDLRRAFCLGGAASAIGAFAWSGPAWALALALLQPACWCQARTRLTAFGVMFAYQLAATHGAPAGIAHYYGRWSGLGTGLWLLAAAIVATGWALVWTKRPHHRRALIPLAIGVVAVPPIGIVGWVNPLTAAGTILPGTGWGGLAATAGLMAGLAAVPFRLLPVPAVLLIVWAVAIQRAPDVPAGWAGVDTHHDFGERGPDPYRDYERQLALIATARQSPARVVVFPESAAGLWTGATAMLWANGLEWDHLSAVLLGGEILEAGDYSANALIALEPAGARVAYRQRMPVPLSMWHPWTRSGTRAYWFDNPVVTIHGVRAAVFICHEQVLVWPVLHSFACRPDIVVGCANAWWCDNTAIPQIERNSIHAWARLFGRPCITSTNL